MKKFLDYEGRQVPTSATFPANKIVWSIGKGNPHLKEGFVIVCACNGYNIIWDSLEFVYVGSEHEANRVQNMARWCTVTADNYKEHLKGETVRDALKKAGLLK